MPKWEGRRLGAAAAASPPLPLRSGSQVPGALRLIGPLMLLQFTVCSTAPLRQSAQDMSKMVGGMASARCLWSAFRGRWQSTQTLEDTQRGGWARHLGAARVRALHIPGLPPPQGAGCALPRPLWLVGSPAVAVDQ